MRADRAPWRPFLIAWAVFTLLSALWSVATPIGGSPDEPSHLIKAASVARGQFVGTPSAAGSIVEVPRYIAFTEAQTCFAFQSKVTADCSPHLTEDPWVTERVATTAGLYNPVYYLLVGWPSLIFHDQTGIYAMRLVSGVINSLFIALAAVQLIRMRRRAIPLLALAVAITPMLLFLDSSVNPNSLEVTATLSAFITMYLVVRRPNPRLLPVRAVIVLVSASIAVTMRGLSPLWVAIALAAPLLLITREGARDLAKSVWARWAAVIIAVATAFAVIWILVSNSLGSAFATTSGSAPAPGVGESPIRGFLYVLFGTFDYARGLVGVFGWLDTPAPEAVFFVWSALVGTLLIVTVAVARGRSRALTVALLAGVVLLPAVLQGIYIHNGGIIWQGRYALPIFVVFVLALGLVLGEALPDLSVATVRTLALMIATTWSLAQVYSFATALRRYAVGLTGDLGRFAESPHWAPPLGVIPALVVFALVAAATGAGLAWSILRERNEQTAPVALA